MALKFNGFEPVGFGEIEETPVITRELTLKIQNGIKLGRNDEGFRETLADAFPINRAAILDFLNTQMTAYEISQLATYLIGGESLLETVHKAESENLRDSMKGQADGRN